MTRAPVSVVIPTYNRRHIVPDAIDSALRQTLPPSQIIVIDDGSKDDTAEGLRGYGDRITYFRQTNAGLPAARNRGISLAREPYVAFLDDDDVWHPRKLELQMACFEREDDLGMVGAEQFDWPALRFPEVRGSAAESFYAVKWEQLVVRALIPISSVVVRRDVLDRAGVFDVSMKSSEDREWFLRVAEVARIGMLNVPLSGYRDTPGSMCKNPEGREEALREILRRLDERGAWRGRWLLRRKSYSFVCRGCSDAYSRAGDPKAAVVRILKSLAWYPLPYTGGDARMPFERVRRLAVNVLRMMGLKRSDQESSARAIPISDALNALRRGSSQSSALATSSEPAATH
jgi:glycosyltransferase involved in cell wall biosynthesis